MKVFMFSRFCARLNAVILEYGSVASVKVPPKAIDKGVYHAFAFIVMKTYEGATNVFKAARKVFFIFLTRWFLRQPY